MTELERIVHIRAAYDCVVQSCGRNGCGTSPGAGHGRNNAELRMTVRGARAEVTLAMGTGWELSETPISSLRRRMPRGLFVVFHSADPQWEDHEPRTCDVWTQCYSDTGYTMADEPAELLVRKGSAAVWEWLTAQYQTQFGDGGTARLVEPVDETRDIVLLACGHWIQPERVDRGARTWLCPFGDLTQPAAGTDETGTPAVIGSWDYA